LKQASKQHDTCDEKELEEFGLIDDCPAFPQLESYVRLVAGGSLTAARELLSGNADVALHLVGGRHHCKIDTAAGFCYCNDIVLAILELGKRFERILYIDIDIHHGDGVQEAFYCSSAVFTLSLHKHGPGFFPGTGALQEVGFGPGKNYALNVPLKDGMDDETYLAVFSDVARAVRLAFKPDAVVLQCGCDGLAGDPLGGWNLTQRSFEGCVRLVRGWSLPLLILGGG
jgi:acetoin utilization deacetylase AcuC-like enzyme